MNSDIRKLLLIASYFMSTLGVVAQNTVQAPLTFTFQGNTIQNYTIPVSGWYKLDARGGQGGPAINHVGGRGASMSCYYYLTAGEQLRIAVARAGQPGENSSNNIPSGGGGGGSSSIVKIDGSILTPILIAGGGGGAGSGNDGLQGVIDNNGSNGNCTIANCSSAGGVNGGGGGVTTDENGGAGGAGYIGDGSTKYVQMPQQTIVAYGGQCFLSGNYGGSYPNSIGGDGGWGGGGEGGNANAKTSSNIGGSGGGGGGYSGGGGGSNGGGGGGGGSYINPAAITEALVQYPGSNTGDGTILIRLINSFTETKRAYPSYQWPVNGKIYDKSGTYYFIDGNGVFRILNLTIRMALGSVLAPGGLLMAYPNPSNGQLTLRTLSLDVVAKLEIYTVDGRRVQEYEVPAHTTRFKVDLRRHGAGVYVFRMVAEGEDEHIKVIVE
jgi:hypothetical protein